MNMGVTPQSAPQQAAPDASGMADKIRQAALRGLTPPEIQYVSQSITPQLIQVLAKLYGDPAVMLLGPLVNLQSSEMPQEMMGQQAPQGMMQGQPQMQRPQQNPLQGFSAEVPEAPEEMNYPSSVRFGRQG